MINLAEVGNEYELVRSELPNKADQWIDYFRHADSLYILSGQGQLHASED